MSGLPSFIPFFKYKADHSTLSDADWNFIDPKTGFPMALLLPAYLDKISPAEMLSRLKSLSLRAICQPMNSRISTDTQSVVSYACPINNITGLLYLAGDNWRLIAQAELATLPSTIKTPTVDPEDAVECKRCPITSKPIIAIAPLMDFTAAELDILATNYSSMPPSVTRGSDDKPLLPRFFPAALSGDQPLTVLMASKKKYYKPTPTNPHVLDRWDFFIALWQISSTDIHTSLFFHLCAHPDGPAFLRQLLDHPSFFAEFEEMEHARLFIQASSQCIPAGQDEETSGLHWLCTKPDGVKILQQLLNCPCLLAALAEPESAELFIQALSSIIPLEQALGISGLYWLFEKPEGQKIVKQLLAHPPFIDELGKPPNAQRFIQGLSSIISSEPHAGISGLLLLCGMSDGREILKQCLDHRLFLPELVKPENAKIFIQGLSSIISSGPHVGISGLILLCRTSDGREILKQLLAQPVLLDLFKDKPCYTSIPSELLPPSPGAGAGAGIAAGTASSAAIFAPALNSADPTKPSRKIKKPADTEVREDGEDGEQEIPKNKRHHGGGDTADSSGPS